MSLTKRYPQYAERNACDCTMQIMLRWTNGNIIMSRITPISKSVACNINHLHLYPAPGVRGLCPRNLNYEPEAIFGHPLFV